MNDKAPLHPLIVLALAVALPGVGHVAVGQPQRGLGFAFFTLLLALLTWHTTTPDISFIGRSAAGLFVWALSIPDAYRIARTNYELWRRGAVAAPR
jgi:hypothetical protein